MNDDEKKTQRFDKLCHMQAQLGRQLDEAERLIQTMRRDVKEGAIPRYHGHLRQHVDQLVDQCVTMCACQQWL